MGREDEGKIFARLGYQEQPADVYSERFPNWMNIYKNFKNNEYEFLIRINNHIYSQYVACRSFVEYLEFLRLYLPVLRTMNDIAMQTGFDLSCCIAVAKKKGVVVAEWQQRDILKDILISGGRRQ